MSELMAAALKKPILNKKKATKVTTIEPAPNHREKKPSQGKPTQSKRDDHGANSAKLNPNPNPNPNPKSIAWV